MVSTYDIGIAGLLVDQGAGVATGVGWLLFHRDRHTGSGRRPREGGAGAGESRSTSSYFLYRLPHGHCEPISMELFRRIEKESHHVDAPIAGMAWTASLRAVSPRVPGSCWPSERYKGPGLDRRIWRCDRKIHHPHFLPPPMCFFRSSPLLVTALAHYFRSCATHLSRIAQRCIKGLPICSVDLEPHQTRRRGERLLSVVQPKL